MKKISYLLRYATKDGQVIEKTFGSFSSLSAFVRFVVKGSILYYQVYSFHPCFHDGEVPMSETTLHKYLNFSRFYKVILNLRHSSICAYRHIIDPEWLPF